MANILDKKHMRYLIMLSLSFVLLTSCKKELPLTVGDDVMKEIYEEVKTPYKYGLILVPDSNQYKMAAQPSSGKTVNGS